MFCLHYSVDFESKWADSDSISLLRAHASVPALLFFFSFFSLTLFDADFKSICSSVSHYVVSLGWELAMGLQISTRVSTFSNK